MQSNVGTMKVYMQDGDVVMDTDSKEEAEAMDAAIKGMQLEAVDEVLNDLRSLGFYEAADVVEEKYKD